MTKDTARRPAYFVIQRRVTSEGSQWQDIELGGIRPSSTVECERWVRIHNETLMDIGSSEQTGTDESLLLRFVQVRKEVALHVELERKVILQQTKLFDEEDQVDGKEEEGVEAE